MSERAAKSGTDARTRKAAPRRNLTVALSMAGLSYAAVPLKDVKRPDGT